jgi:hypothetical protein
MSISLRSVHEQVSRLANTPGTNDKITLLKEFLKDDQFRQIIKLTYTQTYSYNIKAFPDFNPIGFCDRGFEFVLPILKHLVQKKGADNSIKQKLFQAASIDKETYDIVRRICDGDLDCGIGARLINKAVPKTVKILSYMRCATSKHLDKLGLDEGKECIDQCKADGAFANMMVDAEGKIEFFTRSGQYLKKLEFLKSKIKKTRTQKFFSTKGLDHDPFNMYHDRVYHGELRIFEEDGSIMPRKKGNGLIKQCIDGTIDPKVARRIFYTAWDCVTVEEFWNGYSDTAYRTRFFTVISLANMIANDEAFRIVEHEYVRSSEEHTTFFRKMRAKKEEGTITKNLDGVWEDNQSGSFDCIKTKHSFECEVKIVGWKHGRKGTKYEHCIGSFEYESECGKLGGFCSGLTDEEREWDWDMMIDAIATVEAESVITAKNKVKASLYSPSFIEVREDRTKADTLERIIEIAEESRKTKRRKA